MVRAGISREDAKKRFLICNIDGAIGRKTTELGKGNPHYLKMEKDSSLEVVVNEWKNDLVVDGTDMLEAIKTFKPTVLLGLSAQKNIFTEEMIR